MAFSSGIAKLVLHASYEDYWKLFFEKHFEKVSAFIVVVVEDSLLEAEWREGDERTFLYAECVFDSKNFEIVSLEPQWRSCSYVFRLFELNASAFYKPKSFVAYSCLLTTNF